MILSFYSAMDFCIAYELLLFTTYKKKIQLAGIMVMLYSSWSPLVVPEVLHCDEGSASEILVELRESRR